MSRPSPTAQFFRSHPLVDRHAQFARLLELRLAGDVARVKVAASQHVPQVLPAQVPHLADELDSMKLEEAAKTVREGYAETLAYTRFPRKRWRRIRTNNAIERLNREICRRTRVVGTFPDGKSALMLVAARLKYVAESEWGSRRYLDVTLLNE